MTLPQKSISVRHGHMQHHPEINVPLMAIADGSRIVVYNVTQPEWDVPVVDIAASTLSSRGLVSSKLYSGHERCPIRPSATDHTVLEWHFGLKLIPPHWMRPSEKSKLLLTKPVHT